MQWARACADMSGVSHVCVGAGKGLRIFLFETVETGRSRCLAICEAPAGAGVEEGISLLATHIPFPHVADRGAEVESLLH